jgi:hypothetical protein
MRFNVTFWNSPRRTREQACPCAFRAGLDRPSPADLIKWTTLISSSCGRGRLDFLFGDAGRGRGLAILPDDPPFRLSCKQGESPMAWQWCPIEPF